KDDKHIVRVGLSDSFFMKPVFFAFIDHDLIVYEYHRVSFLKTNITNSTIITLKALPTCLEYTDCVSCINHVTAFNCSWCSTVNRCSSCLDRQKQNWIDHDCDDHNVTEEGLCPASVSETPLITSPTTNSTDDYGEKEKEPSDTVKKVEDITTEKVLNTDDLSENATLKTFEENN
ncbi:hypothetical protein DOY81_014458, partial [Sarcophaga bullata]